MSEINNHPLYIASKDIEFEIIDSIEAKLKVLGKDYQPSHDDYNLFYSYHYNYSILNSINYFHPQLFFDIGNKILENVEKHEKRIALTICKESIYAVMAVCSVMKNDILNYRIYVEKMLVQKSLYFNTKLTLINLILNEPVLGIIKRESERVFIQNCILNKFQSNFFPDLEFEIVCNTLTDFHQHQFISSILNYRLYHFSLVNSTCPDIIYEHCYILIQSLCTLIESHLKEIKKSSKLLWQLISTEINEPFKTNLLNTLDLHSKFNSKDILSFNSNLPVIMSELESKLDINDIICYCFYITYMCRNNVLHNVTDKIKFHGDKLMTEKLIGILLATVHFVNKV